MDLEPTIFLILIVILAATNIFTLLYLNKRQIQFERQLINSFLEFAKVSTEFMLTTPHASGWYEHKHKTQTKTEA